MGRCTTSLQCSTPEHPRAVCSATHIWLHSQTSGKTPLWRMCTTPPSSVRLQQTSSCQGEKINHLAKRCAGRNLRLNISKTMKQIVDFRQKEAKTHTLVYISGAEVEQVNCFRFLGISITEKLSCSSLTAIGSFLKKKKRKRKKNFWRLDSIAKFSSYITGSIWQKIQKYLLPYHQTTEQLSSGGETPELILCISIWGTALFLIIHLFTN